MTIERHATGESARGAVALRPIAVADLPAVFEQQRDPASTAMAGVPARDRDAFDAHWRRLMADPRIVLRAIVLDGEVVGHAMSWEANGRRFIGYWVDRAHWGRGIASAALALLVHEIPERPLHATVSPGNDASIRILRKAGFVEAPEAGAADAHGGVLAFVLAG